MYKMITSALMVAVASLAMSGCLGKGGTSTPPSTTTTPNVPNPTVVTAIKIGVEPAVYIALLNIQGQQTLADATLAKQYLDTDLLPVLQGNSAGLTNSLNDIVNNVDLSKIQVGGLPIFQMALPLLLAKIPANGAQTAINQLPPDALAYTVAFFQSADAGLGDYINSQPVTGAATATKDIKAKSVPTAFGAVFGAAAKK